jgi:hypothetical protein
VAHARIPKGGHGRPRPGPDRDRHAASRGGATPVASELLRLQRLGGNRAVVALLGRDGGGAPRAVPAGQRYDQFEHKTIGDRAPPRCAGIDKEVGDRYDRAGLTASQVRNW